MTEAQTSLPWPILQRGNQGPLVTTLQYLLRGARDEWQGTLVADGVFGPRTEDIVRAWQGFAGLTTDGVVGELTWTSLTRAAVRRGDTGERVKAAQNELVRNNFSLTIDGIFGDKTETAVRQLQDTVGLTVDGIVGPDTWRGLITLFD